MPLRLPHRPNPHPISHIHYSFEFVVDSEKMWASAGAIIRTAPPTFNMHPLTEGPRPACSTLRGLKPSHAALRHRRRCHPDPARRLAAAAASALKPDLEDKSEEYSDVMSKRMGASLTYRHEDGLNYNRILEGLIVGSCLQTPADADRLADAEGVRTVMCLQEDSDMAYFDLDVAPIRERCAARGDVTHLRHAIRDFDPFSLRRRLPGAVALLSQTAAAVGGTAYVHCTAGLGRAPATALAYMWWVHGIPLDDAYALLTGIRACAPRKDAIREAAVDMLYGKGPVPVTIRVSRRGLAQKVEVAGLDVGWGQAVELEVTGAGAGRGLTVTRPLPPGLYQFKFIWDGDVWGPCLDHLTMVDGDNLNNYLVVPDAEAGAEVAAARARLRAPGGDLTPEEAATIRAKLAVMQVDPLSCSAPTGV